MMPSLSRESMEHTIKRLVYKRFGGIDPEVSSGFRRIDYGVDVRGIEAMHTMVRNWPT